MTDIKYGQKNNDIKPDLPQSRGEESAKKRENRRKDGISKPDPKTGALNSNN